LRAFNLLSKFFAASAIMIAKGAPVTSTEVCKAESPPPVRSAAAKIPKETAQTIRAKIGGSASKSASLEEDSMEDTSAPESEEVTKKVKMMMIDSPINPLENGNCSKKENSAIEISWLMASERLISVKSSW